REHGDSCLHTCYRNCQSDPQAYRRCRRNRIRHRGVRYRNLHAAGREQFAGERLPGDGTEQSRTGQSAACSGERTYSDDCGDAQLICGELRIKFSVAVYMLTFEGGNMNELSGREIKGEHGRLFIALAMLALLLVFSAAGRASGADWAANYGGSVGSVASNQATATDASGNVYLAGSFGGATFTLGNVSLTKIGTQDVFVAKLDASGTVLWAKNFGGSGNVYLGGDFQSANLTTPAITKIGDYDAFAIKLDSTGTITWAKNFGGSGATTYGQSIAVDGTGNVYLGGYFQSANLTVPALTKMGPYDAFAIKLNSTGTTTWAKNFGGVLAYTSANSIAVDGSGNVYLGGSYNTWSIATPSLTMIGISDALVIKLDANGVITWAKNFGGTGAQAYVQSISVDTSGNVYLGGRFNGANLTTPTLTKIGTQEAFAIKLNSSGATTWAKNFGGTGSQVFVQNIAVDTSGSVYMGGYFYNANLTTPVLSIIGTQDAFAIK